MSDTNTAPEQKANTGAKLTFDAKDIEDNKTMAALAYFIFFLPLITSSKNSKFAKEHAKQSLILLIASFTISVILGIIPILGWFLLLIFPIVVFVVYIVAFVKAIQGEFWEVPVVGQYRRWFKF